MSLLFTLSAHSHATIVTFHSLIELGHATQWHSGYVYAFYEPILDIVYVDAQHVHVFKCTAHSCQYKCQWFLDGPDCSSTGNLIKHVKLC
ncbi:hypothetical protein BYT27DRAFT_7103880 [Phlegmacium glaucopus]|nr:hypothetical protein BYT27DRAFT_7103880 [Phlegmacium glaucopus]